MSVCVACTSYHKINTLQIYDTNDSIRNKILQRHEQYTSWIARMGIETTHNRTSSMATAMGATTC